MRKSSLVMGLMAAVALAAAGRANATVLFDTFGPGDSYGVSPYSVGAWFGSPFIQCAAFTITPSESYRLDTIEVAISQAVSWPGGPISANELTIRLMDAPNGTVIEQFDFVDEMEEYGPDNPPLVGVSALHPVLNPGEQYWLVASAPYQTLLSWSDSNPPVLGPTQTLGTGLPLPVLYDQALPAFRISGTAVVPAPGAAVLACLGVGIVRRMRRRRTL